MPPATEYNAACKPHQTADAASLLRSRETPPRVRGLYLHIPFCFHKCHYCDFYSIVDDRDRQAVFVDRMIDEMAALGPLIRGVEGPIETIFTGGGTPTLLAAPLWVKLIEALRRHFDVSGVAEFTVEANPETVTAELLDVLVDGGVNRMSVGCQSFDPRHLKTLERWHDPRNVERAVQLARAAGITNLNLDLIFAIPGQTLADWQSDLERALALGPMHLSCYSLMYEPNTAITKKLEMGMLEACDEDLEAAMYEHTIDRLREAGFEHYEISNWALTPSPSQGEGRGEGHLSSRRAARCRHNMLYWLNENWLAVGPSASGHVNGVRWKNLPHLGRYLASTGGSPIQDVEQLDPGASIGEQLMLRLRLIEGVELDWLEPRMTPERAAAIERHTAAGLLEQTTTHLRLTRRGLLLADDVIADLL